MLINSNVLNTRNVALLAIVHLVVTWFMVGLIWTIHYVHYPLFPFAGRDGYEMYQAEHVERIGLLLIVPWTIEGACIVLLLVLVKRLEYRRLAFPVLVGAAAMAVVLAVSAFFSAPAHGKLADGFDANVFTDLMQADLIRTLAWTVRGGVAIWILYLVIFGHREIARTAEENDLA